MRRLVLRFVLEQAGLALGTCDLRSETKGIALFINSMDAHTSPFHAVSALHRAGATKHDNNNRRYKNVWRHAS